MIQFISLENQSFITTPSGQNQQHLELALKTLEKVEKTSPQKLLLLCKIGKQINETNPQKASEIFKQVYSLSQNLSDSNEGVEARVYITYTTQSSERAIQDINSFGEYSFEQLEILKNYLRQFGKKDPALVECCKKKFESWNITNDYTILGFASYFTDLDYDTYLGIIKKVKFEVRINHIIRGSSHRNKPLSKELLNDSIKFIGQEIEQGRGTIELFSLKVRCYVLRGMNTEEIERLKKEVGEWRQYTGNLNSEWDTAIEEFVKFLKQDHFQEALDVSLMVKKPEDLAKTLFKEITPEQLNLIDPWVKQLKDPHTHTDIRDFIKIRIWLEVAEQMATTYPAKVKELLKDLINMVEISPDSEEIHEGMGKRRDAFVSFERKKGGYMEGIAELYLKIGEFSEAKNLLSHKLIEYRGPRAQYNYKILEAKHYQKSNSLKEAEICYGEALEIMKKIDSYEISHEHLKKEIATGMLALNPMRALEIVLSMRENYNKVHILFEFAKKLSKTNPQFAEKFLESIPEDDRSSFEKKAHGYLKLYKSQVKA